MYKLGDESFIQLKLNNSSKFINVKHIQEIEWFDCHTGQSYEPDLKVIFAILQLIVNGESIFVTIYEGKPYTFNKDLSYESKENIYNITKGAPLRFISRKTYDFISNAFSEEVD